MATKTPTKATEQKAVQAPTPGIPTKIDVKINTIRPGSNPVAFASVNLNDCFAIKGIKVFDGSKGTFVGMPSIKDGKGEYQDVCFPVTKEFREQLNNAVLSAYEQALQNQHTQSDKQAQAPTEPQQSAEMKMA